MLSMAKRKPKSDAVRIPTFKELRALRTRLGLTQQAAADKIGVARKTWMYWESPIRPDQPSATAAKLIELLAKGLL